MLQVVLKWVTFYKQYRDILTSDIVHVRRPDMQGEFDQLTRKQCRLVQDEI